MRETLKIQLRCYQDKSLELLRQEFSKGIDRPLLHLSTGAGKGLLMSHIAERSIRNNYKVLTIMRRRELIFQTALNYKKYSNLSASIIMGQDKGFDSNNPCQICSIDTVYKRLQKLDFLKEFGMVIIDEAHDVGSDSYQKTLGFLGNKKFIGFTATPFKVMGRPLKFWQSAIRPIETYQLRDMGYLCNAKTFAPSSINTQGIKTKLGEFDQSELSKRASESKIVGDIVENYKKYGNNLPAILFAVNKSHSMLMAESFRQAGIPAAHIDEAHNKKERAEAVSALRDGSIKILCNVNIFSTGIDIPEVTVGIMARPTKSCVLWVQQIGRLLRPSQGKSHAIILDHAGNTYRHGGPFDIREAELELEVKKEKIKTISFSTCKSCFAVLPGNPLTCPECGHTKEQSERAIKTEDGELEEITENPLHREIKIKFNELVKIEKSKGYKPFWKWHRIYDLFKEDAIECLRPNRSVTNIIRDNYERQLADNISIRW